MPGYTGLDPALITTMKLEIVRSIASIGTPAGHMRPLQLDGGP